MRAPLRFSLLIVTIVIIAAGCQHKQNTPVPATPSGSGNGGAGGGNNNGGNTNNPVDTGLCFQRDILPIFISNCAKSGCHDAATRAEGYQFTDYNSIVSKKFTPGDAEDTELFEKITEDDNDDIMPPPPNPRLTSQQIALIRRWINEGAKNTTDCGSPCDSMDFKYSTAIKPLVEQYCRGCHNSAAPSAGIALDVYDGIKAVALNGKLLGAIQHQQGFSPMPKGGAKLSDCQILQVKKWVADGAPNN